MGYHALPAYLKFSSSDPRKTALRLISLSDDRTGFTVRTALAQDGIQVPAIMAFAGARFSRSALTAAELFAEINTSAVSAQEKLANIFNHYGHASVGDMAMLFAYIENIPRHLMFKFFYSSALGGGQERSSRFQSFSGAAPPRFSLFTHGSAPSMPEMEKRYHELFGALLQAYNRLLPIVSEQFTKIYQPEAGNKLQSGALQARSFDTVRAFLPAGASTSGAYIASAREWARLIVECKSSPHFDLQALGEQLETLFAPPEETAKDLNYVPEAPDLIRHTEADPRTDEMLAALRPFTLDLATLAAGPGKAIGFHPQKLRALTQLDPAAAYLYFSLVRLHPMLTVGKFVKWFATLSGYTRRRLSAQLLGPYDHHHHLPLYARTGGYLFEIKAALSEMIDFNRHRSFGRFTPFLETTDVLTLVRDGYTLPLYLEHPKLKKLRQEFVSILDNHYEALLKFGEALPPEVSPRLLLGLLPNAHLIRYYLTGGPKEISYLSRLRLRPGGHINYRVLAYELARQASLIDPLLSALRIPNENKPDPFSRSEFFDRS